MTEVVRPIRLMKLLGAEVLFLTNAAGGIQLGMKAGDLMLLTGQIASFVPSPLIGENIEELGPRFPDMSRIYDYDLQKIAKKCAAETGAEKHTAGGIWKSLVPEASYIKNKYPYAARYPFLLPAAYVQRILKWLGQGEKEQKSSIEVGAGRVELLKKYDMIRTADWKKRGDAHAGRIQREK